MSDPVTHAEIEDVLSSIRRLVSEDSRGQPAAPEPAAKLVLTPALRVKDPQARSPEAAEGPETGAGAPLPEADPGQAEAGTAPLSADAQPQTADALLEAEAAAAEHAEHADPAKHAEHAADVEHEAEGTAAQPAVPFRHRQARSASGPALLLGAQQDAADTTTDTEAQAAQPGGAETSQPQPAPVCAGAPDTDPDKAPWADPDATLFSVASGTPPQDQGAGDTAAETPPDDLAGGTAGARAASVVRKIAELEARSSGARDQAQPQWEPDSKTEAPFAATLVDTIEWRDEPAPARSTAQAASDASGEADGSAEETAQPAAADSAAETVVEAAFAGAALETLAESGDSYLDEEGLRDLVASIVREELQGPLGERITRNVRKLVRREIHRALAAHDLL